MGGREEGWLGDEGMDVVCWLLDMHLRDESASAALRAATLRQEDRIKFAISPTDSVLTLVQRGVAQTL